jgi:putative heme-binding domain-containing protein
VLVQLARDEKDVAVRSQLACSARRLPARDCLGIVRALLNHGEDAADPHLPLLLWWAIEAKAGTDTDQVLDLFSESAVWRLPLVREQLLERLMRRFAATGQRKDLLTCARILKLSPGPEETKRLLAGFEAAFAGRTLPELPAELADALAGYSKHSIVLGLRQQRPEALAEALRVLADAKADRSKQLQYLQILGEVHQPSALPTILNLAARSPDNALRGAALASLQRYDDPLISQTVLSGVPQMSDDLRPLAWSLLVSRSASARRLLAAIEDRTIDKSLVPAESVQRLLLHRDEELQTLVRKHWGNLQPATAADLHKEIDRLAAVVRSGSGVPKQGRTLFQQQCGKCHVLFGEGGKVGPDLTTYNRDDLATMLLNIVHPSAEIREGYITYVVLTKDGRTLAGCLADQDAQLVVLRGDDGKDVPIPRTEIDVMEARKTSLMPEGLLKSYSDQQVRDLLAYLRCTQPLIDK